MFFTLCQRLQISNIGIDLLVCFIKSLLPHENNIPSSYSKLMKVLNVSAEKVSRNYVCMVCNKHLNDDETFISRCSELKEHD